MSVTAQELAERTLNSLSKFSKDLFVELTIEALVREAEYAAGMGLTHLENEISFTGQLYKLHGIDHEELFQLVKDKVEPLGFTLVTDSVRQKVVISWYDETMRMFNERQRQS